MSGWLYQPLLAGGGQLLEEGGSKMPPSAELLFSTSAPTVVNSGSPSIEVPSGNLSLSAAAPTLLAGIIISVPSGNLVLTTSIATDAILPLSGNLLLSTVAPTVAGTATFAIEVPSANLTLSRLAPTVQNLVTWLVSDESDLLCPTEIILELVNATDTGGRSLTGKKQYVQPDAGYWKITYGRIRIRDNADVLQWRKLEGETEGRANPILVQAWDLKRAPTGIVATANATASVGTATVSILVSAGSPPVAGNHFSTAGRLYRIRKVVSQVGNVYAVKVRPPLRATIPGGAALEFDFPELLTRLEGDNSMHIVLDLMQHATPTIAFVEEPA